MLRTKLEAKLGATKAEGLGNMLEEKPDATIGATLERRNLLGG